MGLPPDRPDPSRAATTIEAPVERPAGADPADLGEAPARRDRRTPRVVPAVRTWVAANRPVLAVGALAALVRLVWVLAMSRTPQGLNDPTIYPAAAAGIARGEGYLSVTGTPTSYYPPGYPLFLSALQWVLDLVGLEDELVLSAGIVQALLGAVTAGAVVVVGRRLGGWRTGVLAGVIVALWPNLVVHSSLMLSESLFLAVFALMLAALVTLSDPDSGVTLRRAALVTAGLTMGLCTLIRPQSSVLTLPALAAVWAVGRIGVREWLLRCAALVVGVVIVVGPWTVRNAVVLDAFVPVSTNTGDNLCMGFNSDATGGFMFAEECRTGEFYTDGPAAEVRRDRENRERATTWALDNLDELPGLSIDKMRITYDGDRDGLAALESFGSDVFLTDTQRRTMGAVVDTYFYAVLALAVVGIGVLAPRAWRTRAADPAPLLLLAVTLSGALVPVAAFGDPRFKVPLAPCFALLAACTVTAVWSRVADRRATAPGRADPADVR